MPVRDCEGCQPFGEALDMLGVTVHVAQDGFTPLDAVVIVKGVDADGDIGLKVGWPPGQDWITRRGLLEAARDIERLDPNAGSGY